MKAMHTRPRQRGILSRSVAVLVTALTLAALGIVANADADPGVPQPSGDDLSIMEAQAPLVDAATQMSDLIDAGFNRGFAGIELATPDAQSLTLYWKGALPARLNTLVNQLRADVGILVVVAPYSLSELQAGILGILQLERSLPIRLRAHSLTALVDGTGLELARGEALSVTPNERSANYSLVVREEIRAAAQPLVTRRQDDQSPWSGGGRMYVNFGGGCTTGFAVQRGSTRHLVSAAHCGATASVVHDGGNDLLGDVAGNIPYIDSMLLNLQGFSQGRVWDGAWNNSVGYSKPIKGSRGNFVGQLVCITGSYSGIRCNTRIIAANVTSSYGGATVTGLYRTEETNDVAIAGQGDSGAPVFSFVEGTNYAQLLANGIVAAGEGAVQPCAGVRANGRQCFFRALYMPISTVLNEWGATLVTG